MEDSSVIANFTYEGTYEDMCNDPNIDVIEFDNGDVLAIFN